MESKINLTPQVEQINFLRGTIINTERNVKIGYPVYVKEMDFII